MEASRKKPRLGGLTDEQLADMDNSTSKGGGIPESISRKEVINVLVTGFGPFPDKEGKRYQANSSHLITRLLPSFLPPLKNSNKTTARINIINPTAGEGAHVRTEYAYVRDFVEKLHKEYADKVDLILHIGMANGWNHVTVEQGAYKQGMSSSWWGDLAQEGYYLKVDDTGKTVKDLKSMPWTNVPMGLRTALNAEKIAQMAMLSQTTAGFDHELPINGTSIREFTKVPIKMHEEAGPYLCGFIYYESMATCFVNNRRADVLFCHVPGETDEESLRRGRDAVVAIVGAAVGDLLER